MYVPLYVCTYICVYVYICMHIYTKSASSLQVLQQGGPLNSVVPVASYQTAKSLDLNYGGH